VNGFWDMSWVVGDEANLLDRRKNWRNYIPPEEPGDKCTLMENWQELSGYLRIREHEAQKRFWRELGKCVPGMDLHADERLCAIALIKRLFSRIINPGGISFPSTSYLAAVPWLADLKKDKEEREKAIAFSIEARKELKGNEDPAPFFNKGEDAELWDFLSLEGTCFFSSTLGNNNLWASSTAKSRQQLLKLHKNFKEEPSPFYALLLMDGDRLGALLSEKGDEGRKAVSEAVRVFSSQVDNVIKSHNGLTVYAGGDDVLALLPLDKALAAATNLRDTYMEAFKNFNKPEDTTISAAIVYAHHHAPLKQVISKAHQILDEGAKEKSGRDALAVTVWKTGGTVISWSAPWELKEYDGTIVSIDCLLKKLLSAQRNKKLTNSWIYNIRKLFQDPLDSDFAVPDGIELPKLLAAELMRSREIDLTLAQAEEVVNNLITLCCHQWRDSNKQLQRDDSKFSLSGALLVKFLVTKGEDMTAMRWEFEALDNLFFRGPAPFHAGEGGQGGQRSLFPPTINTLQGTIRYQLAVGQGWKPGEDRLWPGELGDNDDLGNLRLRGPYLCKDGEILFPAPLFLLSRDTDRYYRLNLGKKVSTDIGQVRLPIMPQGSVGAKPMEQYWLTRPAMERVLAGEVPHNSSPQEVYRCYDLWKDEPKVGIKRDAATRIAKDSMLYAVSMVRPIKGVTVVVSVDGIQKEWAQGLPQIVNLGGEGKFARLQVTDEKICLPPVPKMKPVNGKILFTVTLITPGYFGETTNQSVMGRFTDIPGRCVSAYIGKVIQAGGWDLKLRQPRPLRPFLPVGSTWFFESDESSLPQIEGLHGQCLGDDQSKSYGYGQILIGRWEEKI